MDERGGEDQDTGFLPPEAAGPEPELGGRPTSQAPPPYAPQPQAPAGAQPPGAQPLGVQPPGVQPPGAPPPGAHPPPGYAYPPPGQTQQPPPGYGYPPPGQGYAQAPPPGYGYPPAPGQAYPPPWGYPQPAQPDNGPAVAGFVLALISGGLLVISLGMSSIISLVTAIFGIVYSRKGKKKIATGETARHGGLAQAGFIISWISLGLAIVATLAYGLFVVMLIVDDSFRDDFNNDFNNGQTIEVTAAATALRLAAQLVGS